MKRFGKLFLICFAMVCMLSLVMTTAFAADGDDAPTSWGGESVTVKYYSDSALTKEITSAAPGDTIYAKVTIGIPTKTFASYSTNLKATGMTFVEQTNLYSNYSQMSIFDRPTATESQNKFVSGSDETNIHLTLKKGSKYSHPTNYEQYDGSGINGPYFQHLGMDSFDVVSYKLKVNDDASGKLALTKFSGAGLNIGAFDTEYWVEVSGVPYTFDSPELTVGTSSKVAFNITKDGIASSYESDCKNDGTLQQIKLPVVLDAGKEITSLTVGTKTYTADEIIVTKDGIIFEYAVSSDSVSVSIKTGDIKDYTPSAPIAIGTFANDKFAATIGSETVSGYAYAVLADASNTPAGYEYGVAFASTSFDKGTPADVGYLKSENGARSIDNKFAVVYVDDTELSEIYFATYMKDSKGNITFGSKGSIKLSK